MWALGIIMFMCVTGKHPFIAPHSDTSDNIQNQEIDFKEEAWKNISQIGMNFLKRCLLKDPEQRVTVDEALLHPWIKDIKISTVGKLKGQKIAQSA
jgi:serine/threonine protein kinase